MPPTLPSRIGKKLGIVRALPVVLGALLMPSACKHVVHDEPVKPGPPIPAEPETDLKDMDTECNGVIAALDNYSKCPNLEDGDREWARQTGEYATESFAAGKKGNPDEPSQKAIAAACHRAAESIRYAMQRCEAGKRPKVDY
jgi:hypothetical protein